MIQISEEAEKVESRMFWGKAVALQSQSALLGIAGTRSLVLASGVVELERERQSDILRIGIGILAHCGYGIVSRPSISLGAENVVGKGCHSEQTIEEVLLHTGIHVENGLFAHKTVVIGSGIVQIEHGLGRLSDGNPVAEVYLPFGLVKFCGHPTCLGVKVLAQIRQG